MKKKRKRGDFRELEQKHRRRRQRHKRSLFYTAFMGLRDVESERTHHSRERDCYFSYHQYPRHYGGAAAALSRLLLTAALSPLRQKREGDGEEDRECNIWSM